MVSLESKFTGKNKIYQCYFLSGGLADEYKTLKEKVF
jgi:hypothetical protein